MSWNDQQRERLEELLADQAIFGLVDDEQQELEDLQRIAPEESTSSYEWVAAELLLAHSDIDGTPLPQGLVNRLARDAEAAVAGEDGRHRERTPASSSASWSLTRERVAWVAVAASLLISIGIWLASRPERVPSLNEQRAQLLAQADDVVRVAWSATEDEAAKGASGDVVWSNRRQQGFMRFRHLAANNPTQQQYQLWIIDGQRDAAQPIDGGVFDIPAGEDEVIVPISAKLKVFDPQLFAVTIEKPGGVVVSNRERLPLLAPVASM